MEIWKDIIGFEGNYQISNLGNIKSLNRTVKCNSGYNNISGKILNQYNFKGYLKVRLTKNNEAKNYSVHRLVAKHFINNLERMPQVNHINGIKSDNRVENLEWCSIGDNLKHAWKTGLKTYTDKMRLSSKKNGIRKQVIDKNSGIIYNSLKDAAIEFNISSCYLSNMLAGRSKNNTNLQYK